MSRIGKKTIEIPQGVNVEIKDKTIFVQGSKGKLERKINDLITINKNDNFLSVSVKNEEDKKERSLWGTYASHIQNMIDGVTKGFTKVLEINGVGYKVAMQGKDLKLELVKSRLNSSKGSRKSKEIKKIIARILTLKK